MFRIVCTCLMGLLLLGCSDPAAKFELEQPPAPATWPALEKLTAEEINRPIDESALQEDWAAFKKAVTTSEFKAALEAFAAEEIPAQFATQERKTAKDEAAKAFQEVIRLAESGASGSELKKAYETAQQHLQETAKPAVSKTN